MRILMIPLKQHHVALAGNSESDVAGDQILWRERAAPLWQQTIATGDVTEFTVSKVSKDNYLFGLCAIDQDGHASAADYPVPAR